MGAGKINIAVDGPSGAGKSSLCRLAAEKFGIKYVDTGAIYRTVALAMIRAGYGDITELLESVDIEIRYDGQGRQMMLLNGEDVTGLIRAEDVSREASRLSAMPEVRDYLMETQREMARLYDVIMDGRDIGTTVLPDAGLKVFLTADPEERARRRHLELVESGTETTYEEVLRNMTERDNNDINRAASPLRAAEDAVIIDTTDKSFKESAGVLFETIKERCNL